MSFNTLRRAARRTFQVAILGAVAVLLPAGMASASLINLATNGAVGATASQSSDYGGYPASNAINGDLTDFTHTQGGATSDITPSLTVNLHNSYDLSQIDVYNRSSCCEFRLTDFTVTVFAHDGTTVEFSHTYFPTSGYPGDGTNADPLVINLPAHTQGQFVEIQKFNDPSNTSNPSPVGSDNVALSLGELQIFGPSSQPTPEPSSLLLAGLGLVGLVVAARRRRRANVVCLVAAVALAMGSSASAAVINFGASNNFSGPSDVSLNGGNLDRAYDFGAGTLHINGITFTDFSAQATDTKSGLGSGFNGYGTAGQSGDYGTLLSNGIYQDGGATSLTFNNLHVGDLYTIGVWVNDARGCCTDRSLTVSGSTGGTTGTLLFGAGTLNEQPNPNG